MEKTLDKIYPVMPCLSCVLKSFLTSQSSSIEGNKLWVSIIFLFSIIIISVWGFVFSIIWVPFFYDCFQKECMELFFMGCPY